jgi:hypothetical protein
MNLTDTRVRSAKPQEKDYRLTDGYGLHPFVKTNGAKLSRWRYNFVTDFHFVLFDFTAGIQADWKSRLETVTVRPLDNVI